MRCEGGCCVAGMEGSKQRGRNPGTSIAWPGGKCPRLPRSVARIPVADEHPCRAGHLASRRRPAGGNFAHEELREAGSVPELRVVKEGTLRVLILEGDELIGARQNRVANSSVLVPAGSEIILPVLCVERGRWSYRSLAFSPATGSPHRGAPGAPRAGPCTTP